MLKISRATLSLKNASRAFKNDSRAVTALEYGIIASILGLALIAIFKSFGSTLSTLFSHVSTSM